MRGLCVIVVLISIYFSIQGNCYSADWVTYNADRGTLLSYDKDSLQFNIDRILVWQKTDYLTHESVNEHINLVKKAGLPTDGLTELSYEIMYWEVNCNNRKIRFMSSIQYNKKGEAIYSYNADVSEREQDVVPGSYGEGLYNVVCALNKRKARF